MNIIDYIVVYAGDELLLQAAVRTNIKEGWEPFGSMVIGHISSLPGAPFNGAFYQPMVKYAQEAS